MSLYATLLISSFAIPFALSFDKKLQFYKQWNYLLPSIIIVAAFYIACDIYFTQIGVWGFNPRYHSNIIIYSLPLEEWLFFLIIPYASIFLHDSLVLYFSKIILPQKIVIIISLLLILLSIFIIASYIHKTYTTYIFTLLIIALTWSFFDKSKILNHYYLSFIIILIPFIIVNSILTGSFIDLPAVWYNNTENLGIRVFTIPIEDFSYAFSLILFSLLLRNKIKTVFSNRK